MSECEKICLEESWKSRLMPEFQQDYMQRLKHFLVEQKKKGVSIYPAARNIFHALDAVPFAKVKVVILGQDPYHGPHQAHGLSFSVMPGVKPPPSLQNIFKELKEDMACQIPPHGYLESWANQGVLLLNSVLTVEAGKPGSHQGLGWERFTHRIIELINEQKEHVVFLLWGAYAQKKGEIVDLSKHLVLKAAHPSPFSAHRGFFGCRHFSKTNHYLQHHHITPINWQLPLELSAQ